MTSPEFVGIVGIFTTISALMPQVVKSFLSKSAKDLSLLTLFLLFLNGLVWMFYGVLLGGRSLVIANIIFIINVLVLLFFKYQYRHRVRVVDPAVSQAVNVNLESVNHKDVG